MWVILLCDDFASRLDNEWKRLRSFDNTKFVLHQQHTKTQPPSKPQPSTSYLWASRPTISLILPMRKRPTNTDLKINFSKTIKKQISPSSSSPLVYIHYIVIVLVVLLLLRQRLPNASARWHVRSRFCLNQSIRSRFRSRSINQHVRSRFRSRFCLLIKLLL